MNLSLPALALLGSVLAVVTPLPAAAQVRGDVSPLVGDLVGGLFCAPEDAGRRPAPGTMEGWVHIPAEPIEMIVQTTQAPMILGTGFGVRYRLDVPAPAVVTYTVTHPAIPPTNMTVESWDSQEAVSGGDSFFFQFDKPEEMVPGEWTFSASVHGEVLFTFAFDVHAAADLPALVHLCRAPSLLSFSRTGPFAAG
ncbi:MAG: DUF3859 domain-containing protein [Rhodobacteraceae bacterium]|nr:DUF3859 domain-containing protein [Paracoccaceae bacterium]